MFTMQPMDVNTIINRALNLIRAESIYQDQNQDARQFILDRLNDILYIMNAADGDYVPYYNVFTFPLQTSVSTYIVGTSPDATVLTGIPFSSIDYVDLLIDTYQYPVIIQDNFGNLYNSRPTQVGGRPSWVWINEGQDNFTLTFFPVPNLDYICQLLYKTSIQPVTYGSTIALPPEYRGFLVYWLAKRSNSEGGYGTWSPENEQEFQAMATTIKATVKTDYRVRSYPPYTNNPGWYTYNLGIIST